MFLNPERKTLTISNWWPQGDSNRCSHVAARFAIALTSSVVLPHDLRDLGRRGRKPAPACASVAFCPVNQASPSRPARSAAALTVPPIQISTATFRRWLMEAFSTRSWVAGDVGNRKRSGKRCQPSDRSQHP